MIVILKYNTIPMKFSIVKVSLVTLLAFGLISCSDWNNTMGGDTTQIQEDTTSEVAGTQLAWTPMQDVNENGDTLVGWDAVATEETPGEVSYTVLWSNFEYDISEMRVQEGDEVTITFRSVDGFHDFVIDEFDVASERVETGDETTVTFIADKAWTYEYYCSVGQHRANGMVLTLIVE